MRGRKRERKRGSQSVRIEKKKRWCDEIRADGDGDVHTLVTITKKRAKGKSVQQDEG